jgi:hypothetical protein
MGKPLRTQGFSQGLLEQSSTKKEVLGRLQFTDDGRAFRYALAGGTLTAGKACIMSVGVPNHIKVAQTAYGFSAGATSVSVLVGATAVTANQYDDGYLQVYDGTAPAKGQNLLIASHSASAAGSEAITVRLKEPAIAAVIATDSISLVKNPWNGVTHAAVLANGWAGIAPINVTSGYYFWIQTGGVANVLMHDTSALGSLMTFSATDSGGLDVAAAWTSLRCGTPIGIAGVANKYNSIYLTQF